MKTFLKWAGNKSKIKDLITKHIHPNCRFVEPFAGSCSISLNIDANEYFISDVNVDLINLFNIIKNDDTFLDYANSFFTPQNNQKQKYYELRTLFNTTSDTKLKSALFIYLNKHTFNGLCRYNKNGKFNSPFGYYKNPTFPNKEILNFKKKLKNATFKAQDFRTTMNECKYGDIIYCDPPYIPVTKTSNFTTYTSGGFNNEDQKDLIYLAKELRSKGIKVIVSNHNTPFSLEINKDANFIEEFLVQRFISCNSNRKKANEILAIYSN